HFRARGSDLSQTRLRYSGTGRYAQRHREQKSRPEFGRHAVTSNHQLRLSTPTPPLRTKSGGRIIARVDADEAQPTALWAGWKERRGSLSPLRGFAVSVWRTHGLRRGPAFLRATRRAF